MPAARFLHTDSCERHTALDGSCIDHAERGNSLRFSVLDLILGRVDQHHELWAYLKQHGMTDRDAAWLQANPARIHVLGLDYYSHSELAWTAQGRASQHAVDGFASVALDYAARYRLPIMLSETNLRGTINDRISWLRYMVEECTRLQADLASLDLPFQGFCWYPFIDSTDWSSLVREARRDIDPQGIYGLDRSFDRTASELSDIYTGLAGGEVQLDGVPAYRFSEGALVGRGVRNYLPHMQWEWVESNRARAAA